MTRLLAVAAALALLAGSLDAQSLAEAAAREKRRREEEQKKRKGSVRVITNEDLEKVEATIANAGAAPLAQELGARRGSEEPTISDAEDPRLAPDPNAEGPLRGGQDEKAWRAQAENVRKNIQEIEQKQRALEQEAARLAGELLRSTDTNEMLRLRAEQAQLGERIEAARRELAGVRQELSAFEESARRAGVPPGWIR